MNIVENKERFMALANKYIQREGLDRLLAWLSNKSDFFVCPGSTAYNLPVEGGLCQHALNVADALVKHFYGKDIDNLTEEDEKKVFENDMTIENIMLVGLLSSINKANCYVKDFKNVKVDGKWQAQEYWKWQEAFKYPGRGSKSVFIIQQYMKLYIEECQAIAFFMAGEDNIFAGVVDTTYRNIYESSRLALYLHLAEMESTYYIDNTFLE